MESKNILLICGGGGTEHEISLTSANYLKDQLNKINSIKVFQVEITDNGDRIDPEGNKLELKKGGFLFNHKTGEEVSLHFAIPCFHGPPGETGQIQAVFELMKLPYLGCGPEASLLCFNKVSTKLWMDTAGIPNTPWSFLKDFNEVEKAKTFLNAHKNVFIKASSQGSSVGCYQVDNEKDLENSIKEAFKYSPYVLIEKTVSGRELEVSAFEYNGKIHASFPGEIICPDKFYTYEEKYSQDSHTKTDTRASDISKEIEEKLKDYSKRAFELFKLRHLSRVDFFLTENNEIYLNEINTFPGMTPISMFPKMMESEGVKFSDYLEAIIKENARS